MNEPVELLRNTYKRHEEEYEKVTWLLRDMNPGHYAYESLAKMRDRTGDALYCMVKGCPELLNE